MATTPNYGWVMPDPTNFVTDLPADFEIFGDAVDLTLDTIETKLDVITTEGDLVVGDASGDPVRVPVGTIGQVLASDGDTVEWITPSAPTPIQNWSLVNTGGTSLLGGVSTVTITGISDANELFIIFTNVRATSAAGNFTLRFNSDTGSNYGNLGTRQIGNVTYSAGVIDSLDNLSSTSIILTQTSSNTNSTLSGTLRMAGANSSGVKPYQYAIGAGAATGNGQITHQAGGVYSGTSTISSITFTTSSNFTAGTIFIYKTA